MLVGIARAKSLFYFSPRLTAADALHIGLVDRVFPAVSGRSAEAREAIAAFNGENP